MGSGCLEAKESKEQTAPHQRLLESGKDVFEIEIKTEIETSEHMNSESGHVVLIEFITLFIAIVPAI